LNDKAYFRSRFGALAYRRENRLHVRREGCGGNLQPLGLGERNCRCCKDSENEQQRSPGHGRRLCAVVPGLRGPFVRLDRIVPIHAPVQRGNWCCRRRHAGREVSAVAPSRVVSRRSSESSFELPVVSGSPARLRTSWHLWSWFGSMSNEGPYPPAGGPAERMPSTRISLAEPR
jgi:hypothetical protein